MENHYSEAMSRLPEKKLIRLITTERASRDPLAVQAAEAELAKRGVDEFQIRRTEAEYVVNVISGEETVSDDVPAWLRLSHHIIDLICLGVVKSVVGFLTAFLELTEDEFLLNILGYAVYGISFFGYFVLTEVNLHRTLGMYFTRCYVEKTEGGYAGYETIFGRTFCRLIPFDGLYFIATGKMLHDKLSNTKVVRTQFVEDEGIEKAFIPEYH